MIYWFLVIALATFVVGYMIGTDRGYRSAHEHIAQRSKKVREGINKYKSVRLNVSSQQSLPETKVRQLRLVKKDDARE